MTDNKNASGSIIGIIFTVGSLLLTLTFIVPIISVLPGILFEKISVSIISSENYSNVGRLTILLLTLSLIITLGLFLINIWKKAKAGIKISKSRVILVMAVCYLLVHPLGFYIYWGVVLDYRSDGQLIFGAVSSFPFSSFAFLIIGILIDVTKTIASDRMTVIEQSAFGA
jgi:hypothetical protein